MNSFLSIFASENFRVMVEVCLSWFIVFLIIYGISLSMGLLNSPLIHARKRIIKLKNYIEKYNAESLGNRAKTVSFSLMYFRKLKKLSKASKKSMQVYLYDDGRYQSEITNALNILKGIDNYINRAIVSFSDENYEDLKKNLNKIVTLINDSVIILDEVLAKEKKEKLLKLI